MIDAIAFISGWIAVGIVLGWFAHSCWKRRRLLQLRQSLLNQAKSSQDIEVVNAYMDASDDVYREAFYG